MKGSAKRGSKGAEEDAWEGWEEGGALVREGAPRLDDVGRSSAGNERGDIGGIWQDESGDVGLCWCVHTGHSAALAAPLTEFTNVPTLPTQIDFVIFVPLSMFVVVEM